MILPASANKPRILFVTEKWCDRNPNLGLTSCEHNLFSSLETSGLASQSRFHYDEYYLAHHQPCDAALIKFCLDCQPDLIVLCLWPYEPPCSPRLETLNCLHKIGIPLVAIWFDSIWPQVMAMAEKVAQFTALNIVLDSTTAYLQQASKLEKWLPMWTPQDPNIFYDGRLERNIGISFVGTTANRPDRLAGIAALTAAGIDVYQAGGQRQNNLSIQEYSRVLMRSQIALNFCQAANYVQCKGRIFEATLCGAMLLEAENAETAKWFVPMQEYVPFANEADLVEKARYYLQQPDQRQEIAQKGQRKALAKYTGEIFWRTILEQLNISNLPPKQYMANLCAATADYIYEAENWRQQLEQAQAKILAIESSKFWQLRQAWSGIKGRLGRIKM